MTGRRLLLLLVPLAGLLILPAVALAAPAPTPTAPPVLRTAQISGDGLSKPIVIYSDREPDREADVRAEVEWLLGLSSITQSQPPGRLGPKYTVLLSVGGKATQQYEVYPVANGGPRVFRPDSQPDGRQVGDGWFYGRLSMPTTLMSVGVPLLGLPTDPAAGGGGGAPASEPPDLEGLLGSWKNFMGLNIAVIILVALGV